MMRLLDKHMTLLYLHSGSFAMRVSEPLICYSLNVHIPTYLGLMPIAYLFKTSICVREFYFWRYFERIKKLNLFFI
jgi:hypothetical protein